jgi:hypothetical protein
MLHLVVDLGLLVLKARQVQPEQLVRRGLKVHKDRQVQLVQLVLKALLVLF